MEMQDREIQRFAKKYLANMLTGLVITDGFGTIIYIDESCNEIYGIQKERYLGCHISVLEEVGILNPCAGLSALRTQEKVTLIQPDKYGEKLLITAVPIFDENDELKNIITYTAWTVENYHELSNKYEDMKRDLEAYEVELGMMRKKDMRFNTVFESEKMLDVMRIVENIVHADISVMINGEAGSGKGILAKVIHRRSSRHQGPFLQVSCSAFKNNILQDELFGYQDKTGEMKEKIGLCEMANKGTMLIEDIDLLNQVNQKKLLHLMKNQYYFKPGSDKIISTDIRILVTTSKDIRAMVEEGQFVKELFYHLNITSIDLPSLKERTKDIVPLLNLFLDQFNRRFNKDRKFSKQAYAMLEKYEWPGNVCELKYLVQKMVLTVEEDTIQSHHLPGHVSPYSSSNFESQVNLKDYLEFYEKRIVNEAYQHFKTTVGVAKHLGISQATAVRKLQKYVEGYVQA